MEVPPTPVRGIKVTLEIDEDFLQLDWWLTIAMLIILAAASIRIGTAIGDWVVGLLLTLGVV
jgi:hypothetical protein